MEDQAPEQSTEDRMMAYLEAEEAAPEDTEEEAPAATEEQEEWLNHLNEQGYCAMLCRGFDEAKIVIINYLEMQK